jgi:hypothetical protein
MRAPVRHRLCATTAVAVVLACAAGLVAQDRPVRVVDTAPAPAEIVEGTFFLFGGVLRTTVRNRHTAPVLVTLRAWVFDHDGRLKGTNSYCNGESLERGDRRVVTAPLDIRDLASTDSVSVAVERAYADRRQWTMGDSAETGVRVAGQRARGSGGLLRLEEGPTDGLPAVACPCDCQSTAALCETHCFDRGLRAFTCSPLAFDGCSASCSCK